MTQQLGQNRRPSKEAPFDAACVVDNVTFVIGAETGGNTINVAMKFLDATGVPCWQKASVEAFLSDSATVLALTATTPTSVAIGTNGSILAEVAGKMFNLISNAAGLCDINIVKNTPTTYFLVVILPTGKIVVSGPITLV